MSEPISPISELGVVSISSISIGYGSTGEDVDITPLVSSLSMYESVFSKHTTGHISVIDGQNIIKNLQLTGQETIEISYEIPYFSVDGYLNDKIERKLRIYKINNIAKKGDLISAYNIHFCDSLMFRSKEITLSKTFRGSYSDMVKRIFEEEFDNPIDFVSETEGDNQQFLVPNWSANRTLDWLVNNSNPVSNKSYKNSMFLYQTINGDYYFKSLDDMLISENKIGQNPMFTHIPSSASATEAEKNMSIISFGKPQEFDTLRGLSTGAYASTLKVYDPIRKIEEIKIYDIEDTIGRRQSESDNTTDEKNNSIQPLINLKDKPYLENVPSTILHDYTTTHVFDNANKLDSDEVFLGVKNTDNSKLERHALIELLNQNQINVVVPLQTELQVGNVITFDLPASELTVGNRKVIASDNKYLITGISTHIDVPMRRGTTNIECSKESRFVEPLSSSSYTDKVNELLEGMERNKSS